MTPYYRYSLKKDQNTWYTLVNNMLSESVEPVYFTLEFLANWMDTHFTDERNMRMGGFSRNYSEDAYQFVNKGRTILSQVWRSKGNNAKVIFYVETFNYSNNSYEFCFQTNIDFGSVTEKRTDLSVKMLEDSIPAKIKAREDITYEIPLSASEINNIAINPMTVLGKIDYLTEWPIPEQGTDTNSFTAYNSFLIYGLYVNKTFVKVMDTPAFEPVSIADPSTNSFISGQRYLERDATATYPGTILSDYLFKANIPVKNIKVYVSIPFYINNHTAQTMNFRANLLKFNAGTGVSTTLVSSNIVSIAPGTSQNFTITLDAGGYSLAAGEKLALEFAPGYTGAGSTALGFDVAWEKGRYIHVEFEHQTNQFTVSGKSWFNVGKELINRITDGDATFKSVLLSSNTPYGSNYDLNPSQVYMLSGDSIRGIAKPVLKITLSDYLKASFTMMGAGFGIEGTNCVIEKYEYFFNSSPDSTIAELTEFESPEFQAAGEFNYNKINVGYREYNYDDLNGKDEPNTTHEYSTDTINEKLELDLVSPIRADGYGIFYTWVNYALSDHKDSTSDNDLFALQVTPISVAINGARLRALYPSDINPAAVVTGVLETQNTMNLGITPERCIRRLGRYIQSLYFGQDSSVLKYQTTLRNPNLVSALSGSAITAKADIPFSALGQRIFYPVYINVNVNSPKNYRKAWDLKPNGNFTIKWEGKVYRGFPVKSQERNAVPRMVNFQLLAANLGV